MDLIGLINNNKNKVFNIAVIILALIIALNIYKKQMANIESLKVKISEENKKNKVLEGLGKLENKISSYEELLPNKEVSFFMSEISSIVKDSGVKLTSIRPLAEEPYPEYTKYAFELTVNSPNYDLLAKFINKLEAYQSLYIIDNIDIGVLSYDQGGRLKATLHVSAVEMFN